MPPLPAMSSARPIGMLKKDGWQPGRIANHGMVFTKLVAGRTHITIIPLNRRAIPSGTLSAILSKKQTGLGRKGLERLLARSSAFVSAPTIQGNPCGDDRDGAAARRLKS